MQILLAAVALISMLLFPINAASQTPHIQLQSITDTRLAAPTFVTNSHDGTGRLFVLEQGGRIIVVQPDTRAATVFLDLTDKVVTSTERGLLGLCRGGHAQVSSPASTADVICCATSPVALGAPSELELTCCSASSRSSSPLWTPAERSSTEYQPRTWPPRT